VTVNNEAQLFSGKNTNITAQTEPRVYMVSGRGGTPKLSPGAQDQVNRNRKNTPTKNAGGATCGGDTGRG